MPSLKSQAFVLFFSRIISYLIMAALPIILARYMSASSFGIYQQILFVLAFVVPLFDLRIPQSLFYFFPRKKNQLTLIFSQVITLLFISSLTGTFIFIFFSYIFNVLPTGISQNLILPIALCIFFETISTLYEIVFILNKNNKLIFYSSVSSALCRVIFVITAVFCWGTIYSLVIALLFLSIFRFSIVLLFLIKNYSISFSFKNSNLLREQLSYIIPLAISQIVYVFGSNLDKVFVSKLFSPENFAIYALGGLAILRPISMVYVSVGQVCLPRFGELAIENKFNDIRLLWHKLMTMNALVTVPVVFFCCTFADQIITILYTDKYLAAANIWRVNMFAFLILMIGHGHLPTAMGKTRSVMAANILRFFVSLPLAFFMVNLLGLVGGAFSFVLALSIEAFVLLRESKRILNVDLIDFFPWMNLSKILCPNFFIIIIFYIFRYFDISDLNTVFWGAFIYFPIVFFFYFVTRIISNQDIQFFLNYKKIRL